MVFRMCVSDFQSLLRLQILTNRYIRWGVKKQLIVITYYSFFTYMIAYMLVVLLSIGHDTLIVGA